MPLIEFTEKGLYCKEGDFYIDPWKAVKKAVITHAHSDHARWGSESYLSHHYTAKLLKLRLGEGNYQSLGWNEPIHINGVTLSLHPAGHILGSSQVRIEYKGEVWVVSGDYKVEDDGISGMFEPVICHTFITESTFGLPIYNWKPQETIYEDIRQWIRTNQSQTKTSVLIAYSLGKAQRILHSLKELDCPVYAHGAIWNMQEMITDSNILSKADFPVIKKVSSELPKETYKSGIIIAPPSADGTVWMRRFNPYSVGICSGWMQVRGHQRRRNADAGFALSDHADWKGLLKAVKATKAGKVYVTHGFQSAFSRYLNESGIEAGEVKTEYGTEEEPNLTDITNDQPATYG